MFGECWTCCTEPRKAVLEGASQFELVAMKEDSAIATPTDEVASLPETMDACLAICFPEKPECPEGTVRIFLIIRY